MKTKTCLSILLVLVMLILAGCQSSPTADKKETSKQDPGITSQKPNSNTDSNTSQTPDAGSDGTQQSASAATSLTEEQAQQIALDHAGFTAEEVTRLHAELDRDNRITHYDVEFYQGNHEYDYEINAETGQILSWDRDRND